MPDKPKLEMSRKPIFSRMSSVISYSFRVSGKYDANVNFDLVRKY